jgi:putative spermidine/putrescine transport system permease protein
VVAEEHASFRRLTPRLYSAVSTSVDWIERKPFAFAVLLTPALLFLAVFFVAPMLLLLRESFVVGSGGEKALSLAQYARFLSSPEYLSVLWSSMRLGLIVTVVCLLAGYPLAYGMARFGSVWQTAILVIIVSPLVVSVVVRTFAWQILLRNQGPINNALMALGIIDEPLRLLFAPAGVVIGLVHVYLPFMVLPLAAAIEKIDPRLEEASKTLGANALQRFATVVLPLSAPGIGAGAALVFTASVSAYVTPALLGGERVLVMPTLVAQQILVLLDWSFGAAMASILTAVTLVALMGYWWASGRLFRTNGRRGA